MRRVAGSAGTIAARSIGRGRHACIRPPSIESSTAMAHQAIQHAIGGHTSRVEDVEKVGSTAPATLPVASSGAVGENATVAERWTCFRAGIPPSLLICSLYASFPD